MMELAYSVLSVFLNRLIEFFAVDPARLNDPDMMLRLSIQVCLFFGSAFFSGSETALFSLSDVDLEQLRKQRHPRSDLLHALLSQPRRLIISILCGNELINIAATANMTWILVGLYGMERAGLISIIVMVPLLLLFGEITPKTLSVSYPVYVSTRIVSAPLSMWIRAIVPIRWLIRQVADKFTTWVVGEERDIDHILRMSEFRSLVAEIEEEGLVTATDRVLIYNLLDSGNTEIVNIMTPRTKILFVNRDMKLSDVVDVLVEHHKLRIPVFHGSRDHIVGFIHAEDVMSVVVNDKNTSEMTCTDVLRDALYVPLTKSVDEMLEFFKYHNERAAIVLNEFGGVSGMVTMEDILNFIFGEIADDFLARYAYEQEDEQRFVISGDMKLVDFEALTNFGIEDPRMTTIGGVALRHFGRIPAKGDVATIEDIRFTVLEMENNRIARLRAEKVEEDEDASHAQ
ncbi:MAG: hemolysin family protein [Desulfobacterales bacterium]